jgi:hypothetical protein
MPIKTDNDIKIFNSQTLQQSFVKNQSRHQPEEVLFCFDYS